MNIYSYRTGSRSATALATVLGIKQIRHEGSRFVGGPKKTVINWGASALPPEVAKCRVLNKAERVTVASNKLSTFQALMNQVTVPAYTPNRNLAINWLEAGETVVARTVLTGHSGHGIHILEKGLDFVDAPLYTKYVPKSAEYRVHVFMGNVIDVQRKVKDPERDVLDWKVRSHANGFMFVRANEAGVSYTDAVEGQVKEQAIRAVQVLGLDFAGVDVIFNSKQKTAYILEANTACGLEGQSVTNYANAFRRVG